MRTASENDFQSNVLSRNRQLAEVWNSGGEAYDRISRQIADAIEHCVDRLSVRTGERILDVATGTGWTARRVHARGAKVTGIDLAPDAIAVARKSDISGKIDFRVADAESLPFPDHSFEAVISTFGVMFCREPQIAATELGRVCKPGGRLAIACWDDHGGVREMFRVVASHQPAGMPEPRTSPFDWANPDHLNNWLGGQFQFGIERATSFYREKSAADAWRAFSTGYGPIKSLIHRLDCNALHRFHQDFIAFHEGYQTGLGILIPRPYLIVSGTRQARKKEPKDETVA